MDLFSFVENEAAKELEHRRELDRVEAAQPDATTVGGGSMAYIEGQLAAMRAQPAWVMPAVIVGALVVGYLVLKK